ncbi:hypothetical protein [Stieleria varia]|uniref:Uncharacterized protein n=1 Tax=Stieleria varia TaxID=2528005 RepID=A0A5C6ASB0_9BACT|nr:hypothetical protein [Stieleria varia]TWU02418.1 hypothetical protein Pla52n_34680 [Stieleria varia]
MKPAPTLRVGTPLLAAGLAFLFVFSASNAQAQLPNPFGFGGDSADTSDTMQTEDTGPGPLSQLASGLNPMNWKMPSFGKLLPSKDEKERVVKQKDSLVTEVSNTAKRSWKRTKETLNPMRIIPAGFRGDSTPAPAEKKEGGFFSSFMKPAEEEKTPATPIGFLRQDPVK